VNSLFWKFYYACEQKFVNTIKNSEEDKDVTILLTSGEIMIFNKKEAMESNKRILEQYGIKNESYIRKN